PSPWGCDSLCADERLDEPPRKRPARASGHVPFRLERVAIELDRLAAHDDHSSLTAGSDLSAHALAEMTRQIREIEKRALQLAREEGREQFRVQALLDNLSYKAPLENHTTSPQTCGPQACTGASISEAPGRAGD
ncbi:MAG: hypothetical protein SGPRY_012699, partial [Prymnesium sp.]